MTAKMESDDDSKYIFPLIPSAYSDALNGKPVSTNPPHNTDVLGKDIHSRVISAKDTKSASANASSPNASIKIAGKDTTFRQRSLSPATRQETTKRKQGSGKFRKCVRSSEIRKKKGRRSVDLIKQSSRRHTHLAFVKRARTET